MFTHTVRLQGWPPNTVSLWHILQNKPLASFRPASFQTLQNCARGLHVIVSFTWWAPSGVEGGGEDIPRALEAQCFLEQPSGLHQPTEGKPRAVELPEL